MDHEINDRTLISLLEVAEEIESESELSTSVVVSATEEDMSECSSSPAVTYPPIPDKPETPKESMEFLCRSWSLSTSEISLALSSQKSNKQSFLLDKNLKFSPVADETSSIPATVEAPPPPLQLTEKLTSVVHARRTGTIGKWLHNREFIGGKLAALRKRDKARLENAQLHSAVSIASLATAIAAVTASSDHDGFSGSKMSSALASASELLASHCVEMAELSGAGHDRVVSAVQSAVNVRGAGDLLTLTAAAATALRGEAALRARLPNEAKNSAAISPCEKALPESHDCSSELDCASKVDDQISTQKVEKSNMAYAGELMQCTRNGGLRWKHVSVYINKKSQLQNIVVEMRSKHVGGAFSMKSKGIVNDVCKTVPALPNGKEKDNAEEELYFGISTVKGVIKFKCKNKADKQTWVDRIQSLLHHVTAVEVIDTSLETTSISDST